MGNKVKRGTTSPTALVGDLIRRLPPAWKVTSGGAPAALSFRAPDGTTGRLDIVQRTRLDPRDAIVLRAAANNDMRRTLVSAPFLSPRTRALLAEAGASYADESGNLRIVVEKPGLFIEKEGSTKDPGREPRALASLKGPAAARVVRALCDLAPPYGVRALADRSDTPLASVSRVVSLLRRDAFVESGVRGEVLSADWEGLLRRWTQDYDFVSSNDVTTYLEPRGLPALTRKLESWKLRFAITGSLAATRRAPIAPTRLAAVYVDDPVGAAEALELSAVESGGNVMLARPLDDVAFERTWTDSGLRYAALSQVAADLLTSPGRGPAEGEALLAWMKANAGAWRGRSAGT